MTTFNIACVFDINCPWCYIGHIWLSRAIATRKAARPNDKFNITLQPFYLKAPPQLQHPSIPPFPVAAQSRRKLREETYGKSMADGVLENIKHAAREAGLELKYDGMTGTTRNGHRLVQHGQLTRGTEAAEGVLHELFKRYHEQGVDITQLSVLADIGVEQGLGNREDVEEYLKGGGDGKLVDQMALEARSAHEGGVPWFSINTGANGGTAEINGARKDTSWLELIDRMEKAL